MLKKLISIKNVGRFAKAGAGGDGEFSLRDDIHPSATFHQFLGERAIAAVKAIPEPSTVSLAAVGLLGLLTFRRRRVTFT